MGITGISFLQSITDEGWQALLSDPERGVDLAWGGSQSLFDKMEKLELLLHIDNSSLVDYIQNNIHLDFRHFISLDENSSIIWVGNTIQIFGIIVNQDFLEENNLSIPSKFIDLADETYYINDETETILLVDPPNSVFHSKICQIILQIYGWEEGWSILTRIGGNARFYLPYFSYYMDMEEIRLTTDFYGIIANRENPNIHFVIPSDTILYTDPVALGINVDDQEAAEAFLQYIFSPEGQSVWMMEGLDRIPINEQAFKTIYGQTRSDLYEIFNATISTDFVIFNETLAELTMDSIIYYYHDTITGNHKKLRRTWGEMVNQLRNDNINSTYFQDLVEELGKVNMTLEEAIKINEDMSDHVKASEYEQRWHMYASDKYDKIYCVLTDTCTVEAKFGLFQPLILVNALILVFVVRKVRRKK